MLADIIVIAVILLIIGAAAFYIIREKKKGKRCIGCPDSGSCHASGKNNDTSCCGSCCHCGKEQS